MIVFEMTQLRNDSERERERTGSKGCPEAGCHRPKVTSSLPPSTHSEENVKVNGTKTGWVSPGVI